MAPIRTIKSFFRRPPFASAIPDVPADTNNSENNSSSRRQSRQPSIPSDTPADATDRATSPLSEPPPSSFLARNASELFSSSPGEGRKQLQQQEDLKEDPKDEEKSSISHKAESVAPARETSFASSTSQRTIKNGKELVTGSDGEDSDSAASLESPEDLFAKLLGPKSMDGVVDGENKTTTRGKKTSKSSKSNSKSKNSNYATPRYKNTLEALVTEAVGDSETETGIAQLRATLTKSEEDRAAAANADAQGRPLHEDMLTSALGDQSDEQGYQRLLDAVRRTEVFEQDKTVSFFNHDVAPAPEFPKSSIAPGTYLAVLRGWLAIVYPIYWCRWLTAAEPDSRERAFHSGIVDFALSKQFLPDHLVLWIFTAVPSESRDELRLAYCRAFKNVTPERVKSLFRPANIDMLFRQLGANPEILAVEQPISPDPLNSTPSQEPRNWSPLLSVLDMLRGAADLFADDTRERIVMVLFRLTLDVTLIKDNIICSELERTITATLEEIPEGETNQMVHRVCTTLYKTIKDPALQGRLLKHILPTSSWIALLRCRLAVSYLLHDPVPLTEPAATVLNIPRITTYLSTPRFNVKKYKAKGRPDYDYGELGSIISLLDIAIDAGWTTSGFANPETERAFNADIDVLAERIKRIFSSIEDSGVSHLKRTLAKENLEALHYRILYSVRSRPPPKKTLFKAHAAEGGNKKLDSWFRGARNEQIPIRGHD